ncbi:hypothetical protein AK830_g5155 [Neonectria ditissima]|uniref:Uncharacterized protein n=1 Tax=Neonectria ditissima TaxID=78410 RepID=A0A0N8H7C2_9HYPO|nr:hypothetical protein AK830_g5155 [Neonectria ditissima]
MPNETNRASYLVVGVGHVEHLLHNNINGRRIRYSREPWSWPINIFESSKGKGALPPIRHQRSVQGQMDKRGLEYESDYTVHLDHLFTAVAQTLLLTDDIDADYWNDLDDDVCAAVWKAVAA